MIEASVSGSASAAAGIRFRYLPELRPLLASDGRIGRIAASVIADECRPVRAILFDKSPRRNWGLGWHQDRSIAVAARIDTEGFTHWTVKDGIIHVEPPFDILETMVTLRIHLDDVDAANAPLLIAPGSHRLGRLSENRLAGAVASCGAFACLAKRGDIWAYATPIVHASARADPPKRRRVLQVDYSAAQLPQPLSWLAF